MSQDIGGFERFINQALEDGLAQFLKQYPESREFLGDEEDTEKTMQWIERRMREIVAHAYGLTPLMVLTFVLNEFCEAYAAFMAEIARDPSALQDILARGPEELAKEAEKRRAM